MVKIKKVVMKLLGLCLLLLAVVSCQQDDLRDYEPGTKEHENISSGTVQTKIYNQQQVDEKFSTELFKSLNDGTGRTVFSSSGYQINTDYIKSLEYEDFHVLTYLVDYENDPELFVNLVFYSYDYKTYYPGIFRYDIRKSDYRYDTQIPKDKINYIPVNQGEDYGRILTNAKTAVSFTDDCIDIYLEKVGNPCIGDAEHMPGESCIHEGIPGEEAFYSFRVVIDFSDCFDDGGGSGGGGGGGSTGGNPGGGGSPGGGIGGGGLPGGGSPGGGSPGGTRPHFPIKGGIELNDYVIISDPNIGNPNQNVKTLKAIQRDLKTDLQFFKGKLNLTKELGKAYRFETVNGVYKMVKPQDLPNPPGQDSQINIEKAPYHMTGVFHTHPYSFGNGVLSMPLFSHNDLAGTFRFVNTSSTVSNRKPSEAFIGVVNEYGAYVVMLPNDVTHENISERYTDFIRTNAQNKVFPDPTKPKWKKMGDKLERKYKRIKHSNAMSDIQKKVAHEKALLEIMDEYGLKLNLYFLDSNEGQFNGSWQKVTLNNEEVQYTTIN